MAYLRFRRSLSVVPGIRLNLSKSGASLSLGPRGAKLTIGPKGSRATIGLPGSGLSLTSQVSRTSASHERADESAAKKSRPRRQIVLLLVVLAVAGLAMWGGIERANGWLIAASLVLLLGAAGNLKS